MFGRGDKAGGDSDVGFFFATETAAILNLSALGVEGVRFGAGGIIDGENGFGGRLGGDLMVEDVEADLMELMDIPVRFREEVLKFLVIELSVMS